MEIAQADLLDEPWGQHTLDLSLAPYVLYGVKYIDLVSLQADLFDDQSLPYLP